MNKKTRFIAFASLFLGMLSTAKPQQEIKTPPSEGPVKILEATQTNRLEHIGKPDDWKWLIVWVELQPPETRSLLVSDILILDEAGQKYQAAAMDCEVPKGEVPSFIVFSDMQGRGPTPSSKKRGFWSPMLFTSKEDRKTVVGSGLGCFFERDPNKLILTIRKDYKDKEKAAEIGFGEKLKSVPRVVFLFMVMANGKSFDLQIGGRPSIPVPLEKAAAPGEVQQESTRTASHLPQISNLKVGSKKPMNAEVTFSFEVFDEAGDFGPNTKVEAELSCIQAGFLTATFGAPLKVEKKGPQKAVIHGRISESGSFAKGSCDLDVSLTDDAGVKSNKLTSQIKF